MYIAKIKGKVSQKLENSEDLLTSNFFSFLNYSDRNIYLKKFLKEINITITSAEAESAEFLYWHKYPDNTEPDLILITDQYYILFEVKLFSEFAKNLDDKNHQIKREIRNGTQDSKIKGKIFKFIILTNDKNTFQEREPIIFLEHKTLIDLYTWSDFTFIIEKIVQNQAVVENKMSSDLFKYLRKKGFRRFTNFLFEIPDVKITDSPINYTTNNTPNSFNFKGFESFKQILNSPKKDIFYEHKS
ncbi:hypothetical protein EHQ19_00095 [Leptospira montravelensis]|uniref:hypothetical protein n=1 Tax=Leptospira montravelensis TaxID=2484961 RepID=UPI001083635D|nr:hypothetical protein [Leptospira montravelensis]TGK87179.1 hypothetical protein EHQ19_00095 [Leptospira montravelensis]